MTDETRRIYVDADACPFKDLIVEIAAANGVGVTMVANYCHEIVGPTLQSGKEGGMLDPPYGGQVEDADGDRSVPPTDVQATDRVEIVRVDDERDAVDIAIANRAAAGDIVVTQDYGLAAMVLGKGARALSPRGRVYDNGNIESLLAARHHAQKARRARRTAGERIKGPPRLRQADRERFRRTLVRLMGD